MDSGFSHVRSTLGDADSSGISDHQIFESLWHYFFDGEKAVNWLLEEQEKKRKREEKKNGEFGRSLVHIRGRVRVCAYVGVGWARARDEREGDGAWCSASGRVKLGELGSRVGESLPSRFVGPVEAHQP